MLIPVGRTKAEKADRCSEAAAVSHVLLTEMFFSLVVNTHTLESYFYER
jgi:hypothetical protein